MSVFRVLVEAPPTVSAAYEEKQVLRVLSCALLIVSQGPNGQVQYTRRFPPEIKHHSEQLRTILLNHMDDFGPVYRRYMGSGMDS